MRHRHPYSFFDRLCLGVDQTLRTLTGNVKTTSAPYPANDVDGAELDDPEKRHVAGLMRVNHAGEVCAQALYQGQGLVSKTLAVQEKMQQAALEEGDHLAWCRERLDELNSHTSYLNPLWYAGSFALGMVAGMVGDAWSLGFVVETERQVIKHLSKHLQSLPAQDKRSQRILETMERDEGKHRDDAMASGARELPAVIKIGMTFTSKIMVTTAYWI